MTLHRYSAFGPDAFVLGKAMLAFFEASNYPRIANVLETRGITHINPEEWYPQQLWLDVFNDIVTTSDEPSLDLLTIGMTLIETAETPPTFWDMSFIQVLRFFGTVYEAVNNRGKDIGLIYMEEPFSLSSHVIMHDATPYPDDFVLGAYFATARRYFDNMADFMVYYDASTPRRDEGGTETLIHIVWDKPCFRL